MKRLEEGDQGHDLKRLKGCSKGCSHVAGGQPFESQS